MIGILFLFCDHMLSCMFAYTLHDITWWCMLSAYFNTDGSFWLWLYLIYSCHIIVILLITWSDCNHPLNSMCHFLICILSSLSSSYNFVLPHKSRNYIIIISHLPSLDVKNLYFLFFGPWYVPSFFWVSWRPWNISLFSGCFYWQRIFYELTDVSLLWC